MNIAFLLTTLNRGGIENLTCFLANELVRTGHHVAIISMKPDHDDDLVGTLVNSIEVYYLNGFSCNRRNVQEVREIFSKLRIELVINQYGLPYIPCRLVKKAAKGLPVRLISVYHSDPCANGRLLFVEQQMRHEKSKLKTLLLKLKHSIYKQITSRSMRYVYHQSNAYVLLSNCFKDNFIKFTGIKKPNKLYGIPNPVTIDSSSFEYNQDNKRKQLLFVGRIDNTIKRIDRILDIWKRLYENHPNWELLILGDGPDLSYLKEYAIGKKLPRVYFKGKQRLEPYYKDASIILLTSEFEGFGLVLVEGMTYGVVPVAYGSYESVNDIIDNGKNGFVVNPVKGKFPCELMAEKVGELMDDSKMRDRMALESLKIVNKFSTGEILKRWEDLFGRVS